MAGLVSFIDTVRSLLKITMSISSCGFRRHPSHWLTIMHYRPWGMLNYRFTEYVHYIIFFTKGQSCSTNWCTVHHHLLLWFSDPLHYYHQWLIFMHKTHRVYHKLYPGYTEKMDSFQSNMSHSNRLHNWIAMHISR